MTTSFAKKTFPLLLAAFTAAAAADAWPRSQRFRPVEEINTPTPEDTRNGMICIAASFIIMGLGWRWMNGLDKTANRAEQPIAPRQPS